MYDLHIDNSNKLQTLINDLFSRLSIRFIFRPTGQYINLLSKLSIVSLCRIQYIEQ